MASCPQPGMRSGARRGTAALAALALLGIAPGEGPLDAVSATLTRAGEVIASDTGRNQKIETLQDLARGLLDTRTMGYRALGRELSTRSLQQQEEFLDLFEELMVQAWLQRLLLFRKPAFEFVGEARDGERAMVRTRIVTAKDTYTIDYEMRLAADGWRSTDIRLEGISLIRNYRAQLQRLLERQSFDEVLARMRRKIDGLRDEGA